MLPSNLNRQVLHDAIKVTVDVANDRIDLGKRDLHDVTATERCVVTQYMTAS